MLYFHYCQTYWDKVTDAAHKTIDRKLKDLINRSTLRGANCITSYSADSIFVLFVTNPNTKVILHEVLEKIGNEILRTYYVRDVISMGQERLWDQIHIQLKTGKWITYNPLDNTDKNNFKKWYDTQKEKDSSKPSLPYNLKEWNNFDLKVTYNIYETEEWASFAMSNSTENGMKPIDSKMYGLLLTNIIDGNVLPEEISTNEDTQLYSASLNNIGIIYSKIALSTEKEPIFLLHGGGHLNTQKTHWEEISKKCKENFQAISNIKEVRQIAVRAYPSWTLVDDELWANIQKTSETGNLSLLPEQTSFLKNFKFPLYINGQAGSGKSTMLYYLFANAYYYKYKLNKVNGNIIFITENEELLKHSQQAIRQLLLFNPEFAMVEEDLVNLDKHFISFKRLLIHYLPNEHKINFDSKKYLDFPEFKKQYEKSTISNAIKNRYSSELVWFAISTFIKGYDLTETITTANYDKIAKKEIKELLSKEVLQGIEKEPLRFYEKLIQQDGYWDKLSVIKYLKKNELANDLYEAIFCDEAQDFSRIELQFILGLSEYLQYDLSDSSVESVPIVFAGDALQTVNPTGFRSAEVKDLLYNELKETGFHLDDDIEYEPEYNYRSSQSIVNIANAVQYFRKKEFNAKIKMPQKVKRFDSDGIHLNYFMNFDAVMDNKELIEKCKHKKCIIPTNPNGKADYVAKHPFLQNFENVTTAVEAKGIDYKDVVLFGFYDYYLDKKIEFSEDYQKRYFYNKLYVAITRAQLELIIIDNKESEDHFWKPLMNDYAHSEWFHNYQEDLGINERDIENTILYNITNISDIREATIETALDNAQKDKAKAKFDKDADLMKFVASQFSKLGNSREFYECRALMFEFQGEWREAASNYLSLDSKGESKAAEIYWQQKMFKELSIIRDRLKDETQVIRSILIKLYADNPINNGELRTLFDKRYELRKLLRDTSWQEELLDKIVFYVTEVVDKEELKYWVDICAEIVTENNISLWTLIAYKNYEIGRFEDSIKAFNAIHLIDNIYYKAKIAFAKANNNFTDVILWLGTMWANSHYNNIEIEEEIILLYKKHNVILSKAEGNKYIWLYAYFILLIQEPTIKELIEIAQWVEKQWDNKLELYTYYEEIIITKKLSPFIANYVITRWAKNAFLTGIETEQINKEYEKLAVLNGINYQAFTKEELEQISDLPETIQQSLSNHIHNIKIKNFRRFKDINIEDLGLFNLIVGDNNIGKTSLLEAFLFTPNKKEYLKRLAFAYIERSNIFPERRDKSNDDDLYYNLTHDILNDFHSADANTAKIAFTLTEKRNYWQYKITEIEDIASKDTVPIIFDNSDYAILDNIPYSDTIQQPYMPYGKGFGKDLAAIYKQEIEENADPNILEDFIKKLTLFIPNIVRISANPKDGSIKIRDNHKFQNLHQYGEGANKLFRILILLALHKGKRVMIDEIDAGIHFSRFEEFWEIILRVAEKDNTQIFATTHNEECIEYFTKVVKRLAGEFQKKSRVVQMKMVKDNIKVRSYDYDNFYLAYQNSIELRGGRKS